MTRTTMIFVLCATLLLSVTSVMASVEKDLELQAVNDVAPVIGPVQNYNPSDLQWDLLATYDMAVTTSILCLGVEFANNQWYVTDAGLSSGSATDNMIDILDASGALITRVSQTATSGWGYRDLAYDGTYLYGSGDTQVHAFDTAGNEVPALLINGPSNPCRALAYDPVLDHFWTASFSGPIYEFDRAGGVAWTGASTLSGVYGMAWDDAAPDGPWLWIHDQSGTPASTTVYQFDPINHVLTGVSYNFPLPPGYTSNTAGGLAFTSEWDNTHWVLAALGQASPQDVIAVYEMYIAADPLAPAAPDNFTVTPDGGGALNIDLAWDLPTTTVNGSPIGSYPITSVEVMRDGAPLATLAATATSYADAVPAAGNYEYSIYCVNSYGDGIPASGSAWAGLDVPDGCANFVGAGVGVTLVAELGWDNPTAGAHGGYFPAGSIDGYTINRYGASPATFNVTGIATAYTDNTIPNQGFYHYGISAYNASGNGPEMMTDEFYVGPAPFEPIAYDWIEINPNDPNVLYNGTNTGITGDDQNLGPFNLGFTFPFFNATFFSSIRVCSNGFASFTSTMTSFTNYAIPTSSEPNNLVAPYWDDMNPTLGGTIWYYADPANQFFVVEWYDVPHYSTGGTYRFEAILYPSGDIDYMYADLTPGTADDATVGIENAAGTDGYQATYNGSGPLNPAVGTGIRFYSVGGGVPDITTTLTLVSGSPVPATGGPIDYIAGLTNNEATAQSFDAWVDLTLPNSNVITLINRPLTVPAGGVISRPLTLNVPSGAPAGTYTMALSAGSYPGTVYDFSSFDFDKLAGDNIGGDTQFTWTDWDEAEVMTVGDLPTSYALHGAYPNPFNPTSTISYALPQASKVTLAVYDLQGRMVTELVNGYRNAGTHEVTFDGTGLASGVYIYSMQAGDFSANGKMIMMK